MHSSNVWGGTLDVQRDDDHQRTRQENEDWDRGSLLYQEHMNNNQEDLDNVQQSWLLAPQESRQSKRKKYVDLGCIVVSKKVLKWVFWSLVVAFIIIAVPIIIAKSLPKHKSKPIGPDNYTLVLHKALLFFNAQKSGKLPKSNNITWRGNSGLQDGSTLTDVKGGLVGGYYDSGTNTKFHFPMAFAMTMLSWSVIEYPQKYKAINEYDHVRELIKWGTDYLLLTFNSSSPTMIDKIHSQVGGAEVNSTIPSDIICWERPEDMDYKRQVQTAVAGPDLGGEITAALAAASIVFQDNEEYSNILIRGAETAYNFSRSKDKRSRYSKGNSYIEPYYNSTGYFDEYIWGATWLYYATGKKQYINLATSTGFAKNAKASIMNTKRSYLSWDNKLPAAMLLLTRFRMLLNPGYPYEQTLNQYHNVTGLNMCSYMRQLEVYNWTRGGMIALNNGGPKPLQYVANTAFLANLFADYMEADGVPGWRCGPLYYTLSDLRSFATSQIDYILGKNPMKMSYVVGHGNKYPKHVRHRAASIPSNNVKYSCKGGHKWRDTENANPNEIIGAMVGGPDKNDKFEDNRHKDRFTEPTLAGNAGLVAALISLTTTAVDNNGVDRNFMFSGVPPLYTPTPPPPPPWKP